MMIALKGCYENAPLFQEYYDSRHGQSSCLCFVVFPSAAPAPNDDYRVEDCPRSKYQDFKILGLGNS